MPLTPEQENRIRQIVAETLQGFVGTDRYTFQKHLQIHDGKNIQTGRTTGTIIATATDQKIGFFAKAPVVRQSSFSALGTSGGDDDGIARAAINTIRTALVNYGLIG